MGKEEIGSERRRTRGLGAVARFALECGESEEGIDGEPLEIDDSKWFGHYLVGGPDGAASAASGGSGRDSSSDSSSPNAGHHAGNRRARAGRGSARRIESRWCFTERRY